MQAPQSQSPVQEKFLRALSANMHQMAQPLSIMQAALELALLKPATAEQLHDIAEEALRQLGRAIEALHFGRQLTRFYQPSADDEEVLLRKVLNEVIADLGRTLTAAGINLSLTHTGREHPIRFSFTRLRQLFFYLFQAVQHLSYPGDRVRIEVRPLAGHLTLEIERVSNGMGQQAPAADPGADEVVKRSLALAEAIMASAGGALTVITSPLTILADFPIRRLSQPRPAIKPQPDGPTHPQHEAGSHSHPNERRAPTTS